MSNVALDHLAGERQSEIRRRLSGQSGVIAHELAQEFGVSEDTIRRDLRSLAAAGHCQRVYGGALPIAAFNPPLAERFKTNVEIKSRLTTRMLQFIEPGMTVFLDAGSTGLIAARMLPQNCSLTVITHAPHIAAAVMDRPGINLYTLGGKIDPNVGAATGSQSQQELQRLRPDIAIIGVCAVDAQEGISAFDSDDAQFKQVLAQRSRMTLMCALNEKIGTLAPFPVVQLSDINHFIVQTELNTEKSDALAQAGATLIRA